jgi:hypothetical protein
LARTAGIYEAADGSRGEPHTKVIRKSTGRPVTRYSGWKAVNGRLDGVVVVKPDLKHPINKVPLDIVEHGQRFLQQLQLDRPAIVVRTV